ncbi:MAG: CDP-diacylglycerol--serine O-phosphatidyltransferase [Bryobacteraceae bacterium]
MKPEPSSDSRAVERRPSRAAYALPTLFTAGNVFLGFISVVQSFEGAMLAATRSPGVERHFELAASTIGAAVFLDGLDGRIARMTNTTSEFGREIDSLADVISFGIAPAILAVAWGLFFLEPPYGGVLRQQLMTAGYFCAFMFLLCGAARLARFNVTKNPVPKNPGRPDRKYFVGLPIPAAAGTVAAAVYALGCQPLTYWLYSVIFLGLLALLSFLMVSTWRYYSFKDISLMRPRSPLTIIALGGLIYLTWHYPQIVLMAMAAVYVGSGIVIRIGGIARRYFRPAKRQPEHQVS